jgi:nicotinate-nucleotide adenylyltransferase
MQSPIQRLGVMGGTFDPLHVGHLIAASEALAAFSLDRVLFVPTGQPWQKMHYTDPEDRYLMTVVGTSDNPRFAVSRMELDRRGPTYTADTMAMLRDFHGADVELYFIAGADAIERLSTWIRLDELARLAELIAVTRPGFELNFPSSTEPFPEIHVMEMPAIGVSATDIRQRVREARPIDYLVPSKVVSYVRENGLYVGDPDE